MFLLLSIYFTKEAYKKAKQSKKKKTEWSTEKAKYCMYIDNVNHNPTLTDVEGEIINLIRTSLIITVQFD